MPFVFDFFVIWCRKLSGLFQNLFHAFCPMPYAFVKPLDFMDKH